jgi:hypothetical protein
MAGDTGAALICPALLCLHKLQNRKLQHNESNAYSVLVGTSYLLSQFVCLHALAPCKSISVCTWKGVEPTSHRRDISLQRRPCRMARG